MEKSNFVGKSCVVLEKLFPGSPIFFELRLNYEDVAQNVFWNHPQRGARHTRRRIRIKPAGSSLKNDVIHIPGV